MALVPTNDWTRVDLTVLSLEDGTTTRTYSFINKSLQGRQIARYLPILLDVPEIGVEMGPILPEPTGGSFTIVNSPGSFGANRKFSDLLGRFTPIGQAVVIYSFRTDIEDNDPEASDFAEEWRGICESVQDSVDELGATLEFVISPDPIEDRIITRAIDSETFPDAPPQSIGKHAPVIVTGAALQTVDSPLIPVSAEGATSPRYVFATAYGSYLPEMGAMYAQDSDGHWKKLRRPDFSTHVIFSAAGFSIAGAISLGDGSSPGPAMMLAEIIPLSEGDNTFIVTGLRASMVGQGSGSRVSTAKMSVELWELDKNTYAARKVVAKSVVDLSLYDANNNALTADIGVEVSFDKAVVCNFNKFAYGYAFTITGWASGEMALNYASSGSAPWWKKLSGAAGAHATEWSRMSSTRASKVTLYGVEFDSSAPITVAADSEGLRLRALEISQRSPVTGQTAPDISRLSLIGRVSEENHFTPPQVLDRLSYTWNGSSASSSGKWNTSLLSSVYSSLFATSGRLTRIAVGSTEGRASLMQIVEELCRNMACRVGQTNDGKWFVWPWGFEHTVAASIWPEDITPLTWRVEDKTDVINRVSLTYGKSLRQLSLEASAAEGRLANYASTLEWNKDTNTRTALLSALSETIYGRRSLENGVCNYIATQRAAETLAEFYMARNSHPAQYVDFLVPYEPYKSLKLLDVIKAAHPAWPAFYGTNPDDQEPVWEDANPADTGRCNIKPGFYWVRAKTYRLQIEGRFRRAGVAEPSSLRLYCRVLSNYPKDLT